MKIQLRTLAIVSFGLIAILYAGVMESRSAIISEARITGMPDKFYDAYIVPIKGKKEIKATIRFSHHQGSYRDMGRSLAKFLLAKNPHHKADVIALVDSLFGPDHPIRRSDVMMLEQSISVFFPEIIDEIEGFAEIMGIGRDDALRLYTQYGVTRFINCTIVALGGDKTKTGNLLVGRNYDWLPTMNDLHFIRTKPAGGYGSMGSAEFSIGRLDGMNEKGLFIGITGVFSKHHNDKGFFFPIIVRAVLDKTKNVGEAVDLIKKAPHSDGVIFLVADKSGDAAVVEAAPGTDITVRYLKDSEKGYLAAANHYMNKGTKSENGKIMPNSYERIRILERLLGDSSKKADEGELMAILTAKRPHGVFMDNYDKVLGTLYSGVYDLAKGSWTLKTGGLERRLNLFAPLPDETRDIVYENGEANILDFIDPSGFNPVDLDSFYFRYSLILIATPVLGPVAELEGGWKMGLFGTERTYGPHCTLSLYSLITPAAVRGGFRLAFNPVPFFSLTVTPFFLAGWKIYAIDSSSTSTSHIVRRNLIDGENEFHHTPGVTINPVLRLGPILTMENAFTWFWFNERVYDYLTFLTVRRSPVWSPSLQALIPYSGRFLWGVTARANVDLSGMEYNLQAGPVLVFPRLIFGMTLAVMPTWWIHLSEGNERFNVIVALRGQIQ